MSNFDIPAMAQSVDPAVRNPFTRMREVVQVLQGLRGDGLDAAVTARNAGSLGVITQTVSTGVSTSSGTTIVPDLTPPPTVTNLAAVAGFTQIIVTWDAALYTQGHGQGQTNIYAVKSIVGAPLPTFSSAQRVYVATGALTIASLPSELNTRWSIWAKWQTADGVESTAPAGGVNGVTVTTGQDITQLLAVLTGQITSSQLYASLGARINLIDGPAGTAATVDYRIATASATLTSSFQSADATGYANAQTYVGAYAYSKSSVDSSFTSQFNSLTSAYQSADAAGYTSAKAYVASYSYAKSTSDSSMASQFSTLTANYQGADTVLSGAISTESSVRAGANNTLFAQYTVKIDTNGYVSGFGLASSAINATPTSSFIVRADKFSIASPSGPGVAPATPFVVQTTATTVNGVAIPAGVYMDSAYIGNVQAMYGRFGTLVADSLAAGQINAAHLTLGDGTVGGNLKSTNFSTGSTGWILRPDGTAEFGFANIRGQLTADQINGNNLTIRDSLGNVILGSGTALAAVYAAAGTLNSAVSIGANGALSGAGGGAVTIGGLGYSGALNATYGADWSTNVAGASGVNSNIASAATTSNWSGVSNNDGNRPANSATVGATIGTNLYGQMNASNISTWIANLAVDTLQIAGNAITVPIASNTVFSDFMYGPTTIKTSSVSLGSITTDINGSGRVLIWLGISGKPASLGGIASTRISDASTTGAKTLKVTAFRNSVEVLTYTYSAPASSSIQYGAQWSIILDSPGINVVCNYRLEITTTSNVASYHNHGFSDMTSVIMEYKR